MANVKETAAQPLHPKAKAALQKTLEELLSGLVALDQRPDIGQSYQPIDLLVKALTKHEQWRSHIRFFDLFEILADFIKRSGVIADPGVGMKISDALGKDRFQVFRDDVHAYLFSIPRKYEIYVELPSMPTWGIGEIRLTERLSLVERPSERGMVRLADMVALGIDTPTNSSVSNRRNFSPKAILLPASEKRTVQICFADPRQCAR